MTGVQTCALPIYPTHDPSSTFFHYTLWHKKTPIFNIGEILFELIVAFGRFTHVLSGCFDILDFFTTHFFGFFDFVAGELS